jgi:hypothetical protein
MFDYDGTGTRVTGRPAFWRASMNELNASSVSLLPEYVSSCSSGNNSKGSSPSSNCKTTREFLDEPIVDEKRLHVAKWLKKFVPLDAVHVVVLFR